MQAASWAGDFLGSSSLPRSGAASPLHPSCGSGMEDRPSPELPSTSELRVVSCALLGITLAAFVVICLIIHNLYFIYLFFLLWFYFLVSVF